MERPSEPSEQAESNNESADGIDRSDFGEAREDELNSEERFVPYDTAEIVFAAELEKLQQKGKLPYPTTLETEEEAELYFDAVDKLYREVCLGLGLAWPPPEEIENTVEDNSGIE